MNEVTRRVSGEKAAFSVNDFCHRYSIGRTSFYAEVAAGRLVARKLGKKTIVLAQDAETWSHALPVTQGASA